MAQNPFEIGDSVRIVGSRNVSANGTEGVVTRILGPDYVEIDLGPDPLYARPVNKNDPGTVKINMKVQFVEKL